MLVAFNAAWQAQRGERTHDGQARQRKFGGGFKGTLPTSHAKLFFVLFYFKCYPLQEVMAVLFGLSQGQVSHWVGVLTPLVSESLGRELLLPARRPADLQTLLKEVPELRLLVIDGAERPIRRPKDKQRRKDDYSGKKKAHRKKNLLVTAAQRVVYLGETAAGSVHDKKLADESGLSFPSDALVLKDTGFQGLRTARHRNAPAKEKTAWTRTPSHSENDQPSHQPGAGQRRTRHRRGKALPHRRRHLPQLAAGHGRSGHPGSQRPTKPAGAYPSSCLTKTLPQRHKQDANYLQ